MAHVKTVLGLCAGMALCALGLGVAATISAATPLWTIVSILLSLGVGFALFSSPNMSVILGSVPPRYLGVASGVSASMRTLGMMTSMTLITIVLSILMWGVVYQGQNAVYPAFYPELFPARTRVTVPWWSLPCTLMALAKPAAIT